MAKGRLEGSPGGQAGPLYACEGGTKDRNIKSDLRGKETQQEKGRDGNE